MCSHICVISGFAWIFDCILPCGDKSVRAVISWGLVHDVVTETARHRPLGLTQIANNHARSVDHIFSAGTFYYRWFPFLPVMYCVTIETWVRQIHRSHPHKLCRLEADNNNSKKVCETAQSFMFTHVDLLLIWYRLTYGALLSSWWRQQSAVAADDGAVKLVFCRIVENNAAPKRDCPMQHVSF